MGARPVAGKTERRKSSTPVYRIHPTWSPAGMGREAGRQRVCTRLARNTGLSGGITRPRSGRRYAISLER